MVQSHLSVRFNSVCCNLLMQQITIRNQTDVYVTGFILVFGSFQRNLLRNTVSLHSALRNFARNIFYYKLKSKTACQHCRIMALVQVMGKAKGTRKDFECRSYNYTERV